MKALSSFIGKSTTLTTRTTTTTTEEIASTTKARTTATKTHLTTTGKYIKRSTTTSDHNVKISSATIAISIDATRNLEITRLSTKEITLSDSSTALFNPKNMLFMAIFVVGLIFVTLFIVYLFRMICKRCSARRDIKCYNKGECPTNSLPESIHYEEISNVLRLSVDNRYAPLQQSNMDQYVKPLVGPKEHEKNTEKNIEHDTFLNSIFTAVNQDISSDCSESGSTDSKGYQIPLSSTRGLNEQSMTANLIVVTAIDNSENNGDYLTVLN